MQKATKQHGITQRMLRDLMPRCSHRFRVEFGLWIALPPPTPRKKTQTTSYPEVDNLYQPWRSCSLTFRIPGPALTWPAPPWAFSSLPALRGGLAGLAGNRDLQHVQLGLCFRWPRWGSYAYSQTSQTPTNSNNLSADSSTLPPCVLCATRALEDHS